MRHIRKHLHHDFIAVFNGVGEIYVHATRAVFALDIKHLLQKLIMDKRIEARAPAHHIQFHSKAALSKRRSFPCVFQERQVNFTYIEMRKHHHIIGLRCFFQRIKRKQVSGYLGAILQAGIKKHFGIRMHAVKNHLQVDLAIAVTHAFNSCVHAIILGVFRASWRNRSCRGSN